MKSTILSEFDVEDAKEAIANVVKKGKDLVSGKDETDKKDESNLAKLLKKGKKILSSDETDKGKDKTDDVSSKKDLLKKVGAGVGGASLLAGSAILAKNIAGKRKVAKKKADLRNNLRKTVRPRKLIT